MMELKVELGERTYPIYIGEGILQDISSLFVKHRISELSPVLIVTDEHVAAVHLERVTQLLQLGGFQVHSYVIAAGEKSKSLTVFEDVITAALEAGLDRKSTIVALGGGVVGDLAGFVAASYMRGIKFVQIPTTILAHDSSVGGKVAVNHRLAKNIIGAFHQPELVLYDIAALRSLPERDVIAGLSEVIKHGFIWDANFVAWIDQNAWKLLALDSEALEFALYHGCRIKSIVVSQDERENDLRAILNLGHTIGHALEAVANYNELMHGEAISIGMVGAALLSVALGNPEHIYTETKRILQKLGLPTQLPVHFDNEKIIAAMAHDKKFNAGLMTFIIPTEIGKVEINHQVTIDQIKSVLEQLKREA
ncbi:MAG: 3-dehydroquinate synthase [Bacilli bacterium]|nr:3-dehydroquinate synthase [Bacilli bacterium]